MKLRRSQRKARYRKSQRAMEAAYALGVPILRAVKGIPDPLWMRLPPHSEFEWDLYRYRIMPEGWQGNTAVQMNLAYGTQVIRPDLWAKATFERFQMDTFFSRVGNQIHFDLESYGGQGAQLPQRV